MTQALHVKSVLRNYVMGHEAARVDLQGFEAYLARSAAERARLRPAIRRIFAHHNQMRGYELMNSNDFFFPWLQNSLKDKGEFIRYMLERQAVIQTLVDRIEKGLNTEGDDTRLCDDLREYIAAMRAYLEHHETILIPHIMEHFDLDLQKRVEKDFLRRIGFRGASVMWPWMLTRLSAKDREEMLATLPFSVRWLYLHIWEPTYIRRNPLWKNIQASYDKN